MRKIGLVLALLAMVGGSPARAQPSQPAAAAPLTGQMTFLYYNDLPRAAAFYEKLLGAAPEDTPAWVRLFRLTPTATLGLVNATNGTLRPADSKPVMVTLVVDGAPALDAWYDRVRALGVPIADERKTTRLDSQKSIRAFIIKDPEGYAIEILTWTPTEGR